MKVRNNLNVKFAARNLDIKNLSINMLNSHIKSEAMQFEIWRKKIKKLIFINLFIFCQIHCLISNPLFEHLKLYFTNILN
jgi:hypothetical protein